MSCCPNAFYVIWGISTGIVVIVTLVTLSLDNWVEQGDPNAELKGDFETDRQWHAGLIGIMNSASVSFIKQDAD